MMLFLIGIWNKISGYVIIGAGIVAAFMAAYLKGRGDANAAGRQEALEADVHARQEADEVRRAAGVAADPFEQLREWQRNGR